MQAVKKRLKLLLISILVTFSFIGCSKKQEINRVEVKPPCKTPDVECDFRGATTDEVLGKMLECITDLKRANEVCK